MKNLIIGAAISLVLATPALAGSWHLLDMEPDRMTLIDASSVKRTANKATIWTGVSYRKEQRSDGVNPHYMKKMLWESDCSRGVVRIISISFFNWRNEPVDYIPESLGRQTEFTEPPPESILEAIMKISCGRDKPEGDPWTGDFNTISDAFQISE